MCATSSPNKGFTLLELVVAVALMSILCGVLYSSYFTVVKARDRSAMGMEARRELGSTLDLLRREIAASIYNRQDKTLRFVVEDRDNFGKPASTIELTTAAPASDQDHTRLESGIYTVQYRMVEKNKQFMLARKEQDLLLASTVTVSYPQIEVISSFLVECYDGSKWVKSWDTALNGKRPEKVRITIQVEEDGKLLSYSVLSSPKVTGS